MKTLRKLLSTCLLLVAFAATAAGQTVSRVEYYWDTDPGRGNGTPITGWSAANQVNINATISTAGLYAGIHTLGLRSRSNYGVWSPVYLHRVVVGQQVSRIEYFYDTDPGYGQGTAYASTETSNTVEINDAQLSATGVSDGFHFLGIRVREGTNGLWSPTYWQQVLVNGAGIVQLEYFYDSVPAYGEGTQYTAFTHGTTVNINNAQLSAVGISDGFHRLGIRAKSGGENGLWSPVYWQQVLVNGAGITQVEYYWDDANPALGEATQYTGFTAGTTVNINNAHISTTGLTTGIHHLALRAKSGNGMWSPTYFHEVFMGPGADYAEYYWDTDPGYGNGTSIPFANDTVAMVNLNNIAVPTSEGLHVLCIRARAGQMWSPTYTKTYCNAPTPLFSILGGDTVCQGEQIIVLDESEGTSAQSLYYWDMQTDGTDDYTTSGDFVHTYTEAGIYTLTLGIGADLTCRNTYSRTVMVRSTQTPSVSISSDKNNVCVGTEVRFVATTQRAADYNPQLEWYRNDTLMAGITADTIYLSDLQQGDRIQALVRVYNPCATADSAWSGQLSMTIYSLPEVTLRHQRFVFTDETAFTLASRFHGSPTGGIYRINGVETALFNPSRNANGLYEISYTYTNNNGCSSTATDTFELRDRVYYTVTALSDDVQHGSVNGGGSYSIGDTATLTAIPSTSYLFDHWNDGNTNNPRKVEVLSDITLTAYWQRLCNDTVVWDTAEVCDSYTWHGTVYTASCDTAMRHYTSSLGCDSTLRLLLTVHASTAGIETVTACDSYTWHGSQYTTSTSTPTFQCQNAAGCDSVTTLHLTINYSNNGIETVTACDSYTWHGTAYTASTNTPTYTSQNVAGCDSITTLYLTINYSSTATDNVTACDSYIWHGTEYTSSTTTPTYTSQNAAGCTLVTTLHLTINHSNSAVETVTACNSYVWHGVEYTASTVTPTFTCENVAGCDSVTTLHLTINHCSTTEVTACDSYTWFGTVYTVSGTFTHGTDTLLLTINHSNSAVETVTACNSYVWHGVEYTASTVTPTFTCENAAGCDSVTTLHLTVNQCSTTEITACDSYTWRGVNYTTSGTYTSGTDTLVLTVNYSNGGIETVTACNSYSWHGMEYTVSTSTPTYTSTNVAGCDSVTTLHLTVNYSSSAIETVTACNSYIWHGVEYTASTMTPTFTCENVAGCDSVTTLHLTINHCSTTEVTACDSYTWFGTVYTVSGTFTHGTDTLLLTINHSNSAVETVTACNSYVWHGVEYTASTMTPTFTSVNAAGCDSVTTLHLTVNQCSITEITACDSYTWRGVNYTTSGTYTSGNDTLVLTINYSSNGIETVTACNSYSWHGMEYTVSTSTPTYTSTNVAGCDSVTTLHLTVNYSSSAIETVTACNSYIWHGVEYTASTMTPTFTCENVAGCDSVTTLHLTINHCSTTEVTACDSYTWFGTVYTVCGTFTHGTDTLLLTINHSNTAIETVTACNSYVWHGVEYTTSTTNPTYTTLNAAGCDSVTTLHLTVNQCSTTEITACDSYVWHGTTYNVSGTFISGTDTLLLTVNYSDAVTEMATACDSYEWHGTVYRVSTNNPTYTETNIAGCDSVVTLHLTIKHSSSVVESVTACDSYTWHDTEYTESTNTPTFTLSNAEGCDSVITLHLTVKHSTTATETDTACDSYSWHNTVYTESTSTATFISQNSVGCDSITTLHLTVNHSIYDTTVVTLEDSVEWRGRVYTSTGTYVDSLLTTAGCDSILVLVLREPTAIDDVDDNTFVVYPNPTTGRVTINANEVRRVDVYNVNGQKVATVRESATLDFSDLPSGVYTMRIVTAQAVGISRVVKK